MMKLCNKCKESKPVSEFGKSRSAKDGLYYWCKSCNKANKAQRPPEYGVWCEIKKRAALTK